MATTNYSVGSTVVDAAGNWYQVIAFTSGTAALTWSTDTKSGSNTTPDGAVTWQLQPTGNSLLSGWSPSTVYSVGDEIVDSNGNLEVVTAVSGAATSGAATPTWPTKIATTTTDGTVTWTLTGGQGLTLSLSSVVQVSMNGVALSPNLNFTGITPPSVLTWQIGVIDIDSAIERCQSAGIDFELEDNSPASGWRYRRLLIRTPSGYRLALEGPTE